MCATPYTPSSPTATASPLHFSDGNCDLYDSSDKLSGSRKRPRSDYFGVRPSSSFLTPYEWRQHQPSHLHSDSLNTANSTTSLASPTPLANSHYRCWNGLDTPGLTNLDSTTTPLGGDTDPLFRRQLDTINSRSNTYYNQSPRPPVLSRERNGVARRHSRMGVNQSHQAETWGSFAWRLAAGAAGAVCNFWGGGFAGFRAGGGQAYTFKNGQPEQVIRLEHSDRSATPIPGDWPSDPEYVKVSRDDMPVGRPAKRRQVTQDEWVVVGNQHRPSPTPLQVQGAYTSALQPHPSSPGPRSGIPRSTSKSYLPRPASQRHSSRAPYVAPRASSASHVSSLSSGSPAPRAQRQASVASMRSPHTSPKNSQIQMQPENRHPSLHAQRPFTPSPTKKAPPGDRAPQHDPYDIHNRHNINEPYSPHRPRTPTSAEAISKYQKRRDKEDKKQDAYMRKMNRQLRDLIKEGQAALASTIEVGDEGDGDDGGSEFSGDSGVEMGFEEDDGEKGRRIGLGKKGHARGVSYASLGGRSWV